MKHKVFWIVTIMMALIIPKETKAYDFSYNYLGQTLYYTITDNNNHRVSVTNPISSYNPGGYITGALTIPDSVENNNGIKFAVTSIGDGAFYNCSGLTSVTIGNSVTNISQSAFDRCIHLTSVTISNSVSQIGTGAFSGCSGLTSVTIPNSVTSIGDYAFSGCSSLNSVTIPNSVTSMGINVFSGCSNLVSVTIPNSITSIPSSTFSGCSSLTSVFIPNSVTKIGGSAFSGCNSLTTIIIPNSVTTINAEAFRNCNGLTSMIIPSSVTGIGTGIFWGCNNLTSIIVDDDNIKYDSRDSCNAIIYTYGNSLVQGCKTTIIPNSVNRIGEYAFAGFNDLTSITIPSSVDYIDKYSFYYCSNLSTVYCKRINPAIIQSGWVFNANTHVYVPCESVNAYQNEYGWSFLFSNIHGTPFLDYVYSFVPNDEVMGAISLGVVDCDSNVIVTATANVGFHFNKWSDEITDNPRTFHLTSDTTVTALFEADSTEGINNVTTSDIKVYTVNGCIHVTNDGQVPNGFSVYDIMGRVIAQVSNSNNSPVLPTGIYIVKVGLLPAQKVVVVR